MENNEENVSVEHVIKPGFSLVKYGFILAFNFNLEFAVRLKNVLADYHKNVGLKSPVLAFFKDLCYHLDLPAGEEDKSEDFVMDRFEHVFTVSCDRKFGQSLIQTLNEFLLEKRVSTALFCFAKQLEGCLFPNKTVNHDNGEF